MLTALIIDWFNGTLLEDGEDYTLYCSAPKESGRGLFRRRRLSVRILVCLKTDLVNFRAMSLSVMNHLATYIGTPIHAEGLWLVASPRGGIYLYETIARRENIRSPGMNNRFLIFNTEDGCFSFGPGHVYNRIHTDGMRDLLSRSKLMTPVEFAYEFGTRMNDALEVKR